MGSPTEVETGQGVGALPLLLVSGHFDVIHHQRNPTPKHIHPGPARRVEAQREGWKEEVVNDSHAHMEEKPLRKPMQLCFGFYFYTRGGQLEVDA